MSIYKTSNPAFTNYFWDDNHDPSSKMTVRGIIFKSLVSILIIATVTGYVWKLYSTGTDIKWFTTGGLLAALVISIVISVRNHWAHFLVPLYAIAKGFLLGGISSYAHAKFPNLPYQAVGVTIITFLTMLLLYQTRIIVLTKRLRTVIVTAAASIFVIYIISWILGFFGIKS